MDTKWTDSITSQTSNAASNNDLISDRSTFLSESTQDCYGFPSNKIALQFSESTTSKSRRQICQLFWKTLDADEKFNTIMEHGRYSTVNQPEKKEPKPPSIKKPKPVPICQLPPTQRLKEFVRLGMHNTTFPEVKDKKLHSEKACLNLEDYEEAVSDMTADLKAFDAKVVAEPLIKYQNLLKPAKQKEA